MTKLFPIIDRPEFNIKGEWVDEGFWMLHSDVHVPWTKELRKVFTETVARVATVSEAPVYAFQTPSCDPMKRKFIRQVGGVFDHVTRTDTGDMAEIYRFFPLD